MSNLTKRVADLSPAKRKLLEGLLKQERAGVARAVILPRRRDSAPLPLSFAQQRLWFLQQLEPESPAYNLPSALRLSGALDTGALERSLGEIVRRHESLRTTFHIAGGQPRQVVAGALTLRLDVVDISGLPESEREAESQRLVEEEIRRPFDLARGPLFRARLFRLGEREHTLLLVMHHIVSDGWSLGVMARELSGLYAAFKRGAEPELPELPVQYADYAVWQREYLTGEVLEEQLRYWREQLGGELPALELPADRPRPPARSHRGAEELMEVDARLAGGLRALGRESGATIFMTLLAAFYVLLYRYTGCADLVVGTPVAGRTRAEVENLIGFFVNTLALRTGLDGRMSFRELLRRVRETTVGAFTHQELPFERVVEELRPERNTSHAPLFQVMFALQNASGDELELDGVGVEELDAETGTAKFDLHLSARETTGGLTLSIRYSTDLFDAPRIRLMLAHYRVLLEGAEASPDARISELPLLTAGERRRLLVEWNDTARGYTPESRLHQLFEEQAARTPAAAAVISEREALTYAELNARADHLARRLRALGVGAETRVGVMLGRSPELVVALLGVLKAGGAYVPLDPSYPAARLSFMLEDAACPVLLTQRGLLDRLPAARGQVVCVDDPAAFEKFSAEDLTPSAAPENLAYVIYTSGSTGSPKGVAITHASACVLVRWAWEEFGRAALGRVLASTSVCFDLSVFELFAPLTCGGSVVLAGSALDLLDGRGWAGSREAGVTLVNTVPSAMAELVRAGRVPETATVVALAGEPLKRGLAEAVYSFPQVERLYNLYGPTEDTTYSTYSLVARGADGEPLIGLPIANTRAYVLDAGLEPAPEGVQGELYLGGEGLARGYLGRPALTAERFVPDPFGGEPGARLYKTGDRARRRAGGGLEYLGRVDQQVKIRGFRIEPGEIETALSQHPRVGAAVVLAAGEGPGKNLVAYLASRQSPAPSVGELRAFLSGRLPDYMIPHAFVTLDSLPLTPNGKVDRAALPAPDSAHDDARREYVAPRTPTEAALARMWADILNVGRVGVTDNFFELGGDSIRGAVFINRLQHSLGETVHVITIFNRPTVSQLAAHLDEQHGAAVRRLVTDEPEDAAASDGARAFDDPAGVRPPQRQPRRAGLSPSSALVMLQPHGLRPPFFCVHPAGANTLCYAELARQLGEGQPFYGLQAPALDGRDGPPAKLEELAALYVEAVLGVQPRGPYLLGGWSMGGPVAFEMAQQLRGQGRRVALLALLDSHAPGDYAGALPADDETLLGVFASNLGRRHGVELDELRGHTLDEKLSRLGRLAVETGALPDGSDPRLVERLFSVFKAGMRALVEYEPRRYPGRVTLFRARRRFADSPSGPSAGWDALASEGVETHDTPGTHYTMIDAPHARALAARLRACVEGALAAGAAQEGNVSRGA